MSGETVGSIKLLWWNTSLSPPRFGSRSKDKNLQFVVEQLKIARDLFGWDVVGLAEVNDDDVLAIIDQLRDPFLSSVEMPTRTRTTVNDIAIIYDRQKLSVIEHQPLDDQTELGTFKTGQMVTFEESETNQQLHVVAAHWPSRRTFSEFDPRRYQLGMTLRMKLGKVFESQTPHVVLMGDFNDDPCSPSLAQNLMATRDRTFAKSKSTFFYNPFWRKLGESEHHESGDEGVCGTHFYRSGTGSRWFTYDQIMYSSAFLTSKTIAMDEKGSNILKLPGIAAAITDRNSIFDHYPVSGKILLRIAS